MGIAMRYVIAFFGALFFGALLLFQFGLMLRAWMPETELSGAVVRPAAAVVVAGVMLLLALGARTSVQVTRRSLLLGAVQWTACLPLALAFMIGLYREADDQSTTMLIGYLLNGFAFGAVGVLVGGVIWIVRRFITKRLLIQPPDATDVAG